MAGEERPPWDRTDLEMLTEHHHCDVRCGLCNSRLGELHLGSGQPWVHMDAHVGSNNIYFSRARIPFFCFVCRHRESSHTPHSLFRRVRAGFPARVPY